MATAVLENPRRTEPKPYDGFERMLVNGHWRQASGPVSEDRDPYTDDVLVRIHVAQRLGRRSAARRVGRQVECGTGSSLNSMKRALDR